MSNVKKSEGPPPESASSWVKTLGKHLQDKSLYALSVCADLLLTPDDTLLLSVESYGEDRKPRKKALFQHRVRKLSIMWFLLLKSLVM